MSPLLLASDTAFDFAANPPTTGELLFFAILLGVHGLAGLIVYFLPALLARSTQQRRFIFWLNLLLGWTILGWIGAFVWALISPPRTADQASGLAAATGSNDCP